MNILHIISSSGIYGAENVLLGLAESLKKNGHTPHIVCLKSALKPDPDMYLEAQKRNILSAVEICRNKLDIKALTNIRKFTLKNDIQFIHSHGYKANFYGWIVSKFTKIPIIATLHGWTAEDVKVKLYEKIDRLILRGMDHLVAVSPRIHEQLRGMGLKDKRITFVPNAVDTEKFKPGSNNDKFRERLGLKDNFVIGTVGRLSIEKGQGYLLRAFKDIASVVPKAKLLIVGDGRLKDNLQQEAKNLGLEDRVVFSGNQKDMVSVYKAIDIFVLPSLTEGLPLVLLEAMSMGLAVVATGVGAVPYVIGEGEGIIVPPQNTKALNEAVLGLVADPSHRNAVSIKARERAVNDFSIGSFSNKYIGLYKMVMGRGSRVGVVRSPSAC